MFAVLAFSALTILVAIVIAPPMIQAGVNPWVVHFFAFFLACFGELTPPTSLVAAVTAKIANANFYSVLNRALQICISLFTLMVAVFVHPELVIKPGIEQIGAAFLVGIATIGMSFSLQARFSDIRLVDRAIRVVNAAFALVALFVPNYTIASAACVPVLLTIGYWVIYRRRIEAGEPEVVELDAKALEPAAAGNGVALPAPCDGPSTPRAYRAAGAPPNSRRLGLRSRFLNVTSTWPKVR